jgi:hypothetical protein
LSALARICCKWRLAIFAIPGWDFQMMASEAPTGRITCIPFGIQVIMDGAHFSVASSFTVSANDSGNAAHSEFGAVFKLGGVEIICRREQLASAAAGYWRASTLRTARWDDGLAFSSESPDEDDLDKHSARARFRRYHEFAALSVSNSLCGMSPFANKVPLLIGGVKTKFCALFENVVISQF